MSIGACLSSVINITSLPQILPVCALLSAVNIATTFKSAQVLDETHINNQRAHLIFENYFSTPLKAERVLQSTREVNYIEKFYLPNFMNFQRCSFIKFSEREIAKVLTQDRKKYYAKSVYKQLQKPGRHFAYHIAFLPGYKHFLKRFVNNGRPYVIHLNLVVDATPRDILESYYFARILDQKLQTNQNSKEHIFIESAIKQAEDEFLEIDFLKFEQDLVQGGWSTDRIYLEQKRNRYSVYFD